MLRHRHNWTRGVAAQHASLSRWRSPVRIRSGPPRTAFPYAPSARPDGAFSSRRGAGRRRRSGELRRLVCQYPQVNGRPLLVVPVLLAIALALTAIGLGVGSVWTGAGGNASSVVPFVTGVPEASRGAAPTAASSAVSSSPLGSDANGPVAIVPVTNFRATATSTSRSEVAAVLAGSSKRYDALELVAGEADAILASLGLDPPTDASRLVRAADVTAVAADLTRTGKRLGLVRADAVGPEVRALAWGDKALFGVDRVKTLADWPLSASLPLPSSGAAFDPATTWTLFAGGDILLDRGVYQTVKLRRKGVDFPFNGGSAEITSRYCCSTFGWQLPRTQRTGNAGEFRSLIEGADLAIANFENPAPDKPRYHTSGTVFSADPALIAGLANAGIDYVSLANNHIRDAGGLGLPPDDRQPAQATGSRPPVRAGTWPPPAGRACSRRVAADGRHPRLRRDRSRIPRDRDPDRERAARGQLRPRGRQGRSGRRSAAGDRVSPLGHRIPVEALRGRSRSWPA